MIRIDGWHRHGKVFEMHTSRSSFFSTMLTNRVMDYPFPNKHLSVRQTHYKFPNVPTLEESQLSDHLGFNMFVISSDGYVPFVKRFGTLSVGKNMFGCSVSGAVKERYALTPEGKDLDMEHLVSSFVNEMRDELGIASGDIEYKDKLPVKFISAYRDIVEGGKPHFLLCTYVNKTKDEIVGNFNEYLKSPASSGLVDGDELHWIPVNDFPDLCVVPYGVVYKGKWYELTASHAACVVMFMKYLKEHVDL